MTNGTKIKTMKDDLLEIENKMSQSSKVPKEKPEPAPVAIGAVSTGSFSQKSASRIDKHKTESGTEDLKTKELKAIIDRISKKRENDSGLQQPKPKETIQKRVEQATKEHETELKELLDRISKRENEAEKPLARKMEEKTPVIEMMEPVSSQQIPVPRPIAQKPIETLTKPKPAKLSKPLIQPTPTSPVEIKNEIAPDEKLANAKVKEAKEILNKITKKEDELKELLEKMSKKEDEAEKLLAQKMEEKTPDIEKSETIPFSQIQTPRPIVKKPIEPLIQQMPKSKIQPAKPIYPSIEIPAKEEKMKENTSLMKKIKERLFGLKKEKISEPKQPIQKESEKIKAENKEYFKKIAEEKQQKERKIDKVEEKFSKIPKKDEISDIPSKKIDEFANFSGIINNLDNKETQKNDQETKKRSDYLDTENYVAPENRLIFGKQEHYSSIRKKIEEKLEDDELDELKKKTVIKKNEVLTEKEEQKKLRQRIVSKYHLNTSSSLFKKIFVFTVIIIALMGGGLYYYISTLKPVIIDEGPIAITGSELKEFSSVKDSVETSSEQIRKLKALEEESRKKFATNANIRFFKLIIKDKNGNIVGLKEALEDIGINIENFPTGFMELYENEYNFLVFKTQRNTYRLAVAFKTKEPDTTRNFMNNWENDKEKMASALSPLFITDIMANTFNNFFQSGNYKNVFMRYLSLPDKDTAIDYFIHNDLLVIATSKDDIFKMIDIITMPQ